MCRVTFKTVIKMITLSDCEGRLPEDGCVSGLLSLQFSGYPDNHIWCFHCVLDIFMYSFYIAYFSFLLFILFLLKDLLVHYVFLHSDSNPVTGVYFDHFIHQFLNFSFLSEGCIVTVCLF